MDNSGEQALDVFRLSSDKQFSIAKLLPGTVLSLKGTSVKKEMLDSTARRRRGTKVKNYLLKDRKHKKLYRAKPESLGASRAKYVLFVQKGNCLYYTPVDLFKAAPEIVSQEELSLEDVEESEMRRREKFELKVKSHKRVMSMLERAAEGQEDSTLAIKSRSRSAMGKAKRDAGLGDEERDADFDDVFDDDEEAPVTLQSDAEPETQEEIQNEEVLCDCSSDALLKLCFFQKIKHALKISEEMEELSESEESEFEDDMDDIEQEDSSSEEEDQQPCPAKKRQLSQDAVEENQGPKRVKIESDSVVAAAAAPAAKRPEPGVTEADVRQQFEVHGRLTAKSLASLLEEKWKYGGPTARQKLFAIVKRICKITEDSRRPGIKYLVLKQ